MKKINKILLGIILILIALVIFLQDSRYYYLLPSLGNWSILALIIAGILIYWSIKNLIKKNFMNSSFFITVFVLLNKGNLNIGNISNWKIILIGFLVGAGLSLVFNGKGTNINFTVNSFGKEYSGKKKIARFSADDNFIKIEKVFGSSVEYIEPMDLSGGDIEVVFSNLSLYLDKVDPIDNTVNLELSSVFSSFSLYIPKDWKLVTDTSLVGANITEHNYDSSVEKTKTLRLRGEGVFSSIKIYYI